MNRLQRRLLEWYRRNGRATLPWRIVRNPYYTLVSEFMLQQTQVDRVVPAFERFVERFPSLETLAAASLGDVLREWRGLGYNSRAVRLKRVAEIVCDRHGAALPRESAALRALPGVGAYTAAAIRAFAFDIDDAPIDTNVRRIVHRLAFGPEHLHVAKARELDERARALVPAGEAHDWSSALMDLGSTICTSRTPKCLLCPLQHDCAAAPMEARPAAATRKTVAFEQTARYARGRILDRLRDLSPGQRISLLDLHRRVEPELPGRSAEEVQRFVTALERDGLVARDGNLVALPE